MGLNARSAQGALRLSRLSDTSHRLETTLIRLGGNFEDLERHLLRNLRKYAHRDVVEWDSLWHWLSLAQHYRLPTRLMD